MSFTVFLGNLPTWVTADDIQSWLNAEALVADSIKVIRNPETQESKGFAFIEAPNGEEMQSIIRRFDRAPLEDKMLRANPAQPPKGKGLVRGPEERRPGTLGPRRDMRDAGAPREYAPRDYAAPREGVAREGAPREGAPAATRPPMETRPAAEGRPVGDRPASTQPAANPTAAANAAAADRNRAAKRRTRPASGTSAFAEELAKAL